MKHSIIRMKGQHYMLTNNCVTIADALLKTAKPMTYSELCTKTKISLASMHVHISRLRKTGLVTTQNDKATGDVVIKFPYRAVVVPSLRV